MPLGAASSRSRACCRIDTLAASTCPSGGAGCVLSVRPPVLPRCELSEADTPGGCVAAAGFAAGAGGRRGPYLRYRTVLACSMRRFAAPGQSTGCFAAASGRASPPAACSTGGVVALSTRPNTQVADPAHQPGAGGIRVNTCENWGSLQHSPWYLFKPVESLLMTCAASCCSCAGT
jgi:hypothetical protein